MSDHADLELRPGEYLRQARERAGLDCQEVAEQLNLTAWQIETLEAEEYTALPGPTFVQGYLRAYARLLNLDGTALVMAYRARYAELQPDRVRRQRPSLDHGSAQRYWGLAALVMVLAGLWAWQHWSVPEGSTLAEVPAPVQSAAAPSILSEVLPAPIALRAGNALQREAMAPAPFRMQGLDSELRNPAAGADRQTATVTVDNG